DGIPIEKAKEIVRHIKDSKIKVQAAIQEKQVRMSGKNRDDLQAAIALVKGKDLGVALQFTSYRSAGVPRPDTNPCGSRARPLPPLGVSRILQWGFRASQSLTP